MEATETGRKHYNKNYSQKKDRWSIHKITIAKRIVKRIIKKTNLKPSNNSYTALDVGCAKGHITEALRLEGFDAYGIDYSDVAISKAKNNFSNCHFKCMNGLNPNLNQKFDLILVRGFTGANTHDMKAIAGFSKKYISLLKKGGVYILGIRTNLKGFENGKEMANITYEEIANLNNLLGHKLDIHFFFPPKWWVDLKNIVLFPLIMTSIKKRRPKYFVYFSFKKE